MDARKGRTIIGGVVLALLLVALAFLGFYLAIIKPSAGNTSATSMARSEILRTSVTDASGENHSVQARFAVEIDNELSDGVNTKEVFSIIDRTLARLDYDRMSGPDGLQYVKDAIMEALGDTENIDMDAILGLYATDFLTDFDLGNPAVPNNTNNRVSNIFKGLFKNAN